MDCPGTCNPFAWLARLFGAQEAAAEDALSDAAPDAVPDESAPEAEREIEAAPVSAAAAVPAPGGDDLRTGEVVGRIWIAPFVDAAGVYREAGWVRVVIAPAALETAVIGRLMALMEGPESLASWAPPEMPPPLHELLPWRAWDPASELYVNARSHGFVLELPPFAGIDEETLGALSGTLADAAPEHCTIQAIHWASPRFGAPLAAWAEARAEKSGARATMARCRREMFAHAGWRPLHEGGPPYTLSDYRVFVTACLPGAPGPASETALGGFRRALEGTLASAGATARRLEPDALLSLAAELAAPCIPGTLGPIQVKAGPGARAGAGRRATRSTCSAPPPDARSRSRRPGWYSTIPTAPTWRSGCSRRWPSPRSGRAGAATR